MDEEEERRRDLLRGASCEMSCVVWYGINKRANPERGFLGSSSLRETFETNFRVICADSGGFRTKIIPQKKKGLGFFGAKIGIDEEV